MKVSSNTEKCFVPITLNLVFETQEELDRFYAIFNHIKIADFLDPHDKNANEIRLNIEKYISTNHNKYWAELDKGIDKNG